jgi:hypothetical protein
MSRLGNRRRLMPVIGYLSARSPDDTAHLVEARMSPSSAAGQSGQHNRLRGLAEELVNQQGAVVVSTGGDSAALGVASGPFFDTRRDKLVGLAAHHVVPAMCHFREFVAADGLMSYGIDARDNIQVGLMPDVSSEARTPPNYRCSNRLGSSSWLT